MMAELSLVEQEYSTLSGELSILKTRASQLSEILNRPIADLNHLSSVRPGVNAVPAIPCLLHSFCPVCPVSF